MTMYIIYVNGRAQWPRAMTACNTSPRCQNSFTRKLTPADRRHAGIDSEAFRVCKPDNGHILLLRRRKPDPEKGRFAATAVPYRYYARLARRQWVEAAAAAAATSVRCENIEKTSFGVSSPLRARVPYNPFRCTARSYYIYARVYYAIILFTSYCLLLLLMAIS